MDMEMLEPRRDVKGMSVTWQSGRKEGIEGKYRMGKGIKGHCAGS